MKRLVVGVAGMSCQGCVKNVTGVLQALPGVAEVKVSLEEARAEIAYDPQLVKPTQFKQAIEGAGFDVVCDGTCPESCAS
ncbi:heavy-metal-associated domain-containing protein [Propionivibrio sp.]|mgnify:CR=1 FL=1|jgi:copper chaperone|uniref:heavy-metal-associated domain-containing protein n=1 Tax=Propionivibrio sp. TaxID=2212460 RepID=UPI0039E4EFE4